MDFDLSQLGGLPSPVDLQPSDKVVVVRNGVAYKADMQAVKTEAEGGALLAANNLSDVSNAATARSNLGAETSGAAAAAQAAAIAACDPAGAAAAAQAAAIAASDPAGAAAAAQAAAIAACDPAGAAAAAQAASDPAGSAAAAQAAAASDATSKANAAQAAAVASSAQKANNLDDLANKNSAAYNLVTASPWDDWRWSGSGVNPPGAPTPAVLTEIATDKWAYLFTDGSVMAFPDQQIPHDYREGTDITPHIHFASTVSETINCTWTMIFHGAKSADTGEPEEAPLTLTASYNQAAVAGQTITLNFSGVIPGSGRKISSTGTITLKLTLTSGTGLWIKGFDGHYQKDRFGSVSATSKN